jgi:hypothetical protein
MGRRYHLPISQTSIRARGRDALHRLVELRKAPDRDFGVAKAAPFARDRSRR